MFGKFTIAAGLVAGLVSAAMAETPTCSPDMRHPRTRRRSRRQSATFPLSFGLPADKATIARLYDEMDFQRATQAYIWALPIVGFAEWQASTKQTLGASDTDLVIYETVKDTLLGHGFPQVVGIIADCDAGQTRFPPGYRRELSTA